MIELSKVISMLQILLVVFGGVIKDDNFGKLTISLFAWAHSCTFAYSLFASSVDVA